MNNNMINKNMINKAFTYAEYLRDLCRKFYPCFGCPFCWIGDTSSDFHCSLDSTFCYPCDWDLEKCRLD